MKKLTVSMTRTEVILGIVYLAAQILVLPSAMLLINQLLGQPLSPVQLNFAFFCVDFICITAIFHRFLWRSAKLSFMTPFQCLRYAGAGLVLYWIASYLISIIIFMVSPGFSNVNDQSIMELTRENYSLMAVGTVLLVPVVEETLYRGIVFGRLYHRSPLAAYAVSTLAFSALHVVGYIGLYDPLQLLLCLVQYIPAGVCLAWAYVKADSIWAPILMHITINQIGVLSMR